MPPCRCSASEKPAFFTAASASAERTPVLQYSTGMRSCGNLARPSPDSITDFGISSAPVDVVDLPLHRLADVDQRQLLAGVEQLAQLRGVTVESCAASAASSDTTPQNDS